MNLGRLLPLALALALSGARAAALSTDLSLAGSGPHPAPSIKSLIAELTEELAKKELDTAQRIELIKKLAAQFSLAGTKDRSTIVKALERCLSTRVTGKADLELADLTARALSTMAPESVPVLLRAVDNKSLMKDPELARTLVLALGKTRDKSVIKTLSGLLDHNQAHLVASAGEALGEFDQAALETRKKLFEELLKTLVSAKDTRDAALQTAAQTATMADPSYAQRYDTLQPALCTALARLAHEEARTPEQWQSWWNKNKRANWDEKPKLAKA